MVTGGEYLFMWTQGDKCSYDTRFINIGNWSVVSGRINAYLMEYNIFSQVRKTLIHNFSHSMTLFQ